jgi:plastocyanin
MNRFRHRLVGFIAGLAGLSLVALAAGGIGLAQDSTSAEAAPARPIHIHEGTCDNLDPAPLHVLSDVVSPAGEVQYGGDGAPTAVQISESTVDATLADLVAGQFAINVHESADNIENYIACGEIGGVVADGTTLAIGLRELNDSGQSGVAVLEGDGEQTTVTVYLAGALAAGTEASTPTAAHSGHEAPAAATTVEIKDFLYSPDPITIAAGDSVTWTNLDAAPHTATAADRDVLQTKRLNQGESATITFDAAGTYEYFCEFHPQMSGTLIVQ